MFLCIMDDDTNQMATAILPALTRCQQHATENLRQLLQILFVIDYDKMGRIAATSYTSYLCLLVTGCNIVLFLLKNAF
jgi:hypothetical protein